MCAFSRFHIAGRTVVAVLALSGFAPSQTKNATKAPGAPPQAEIIRLPLLEGRDLQFKHLTTAGLSQTRVGQILQDDRGFIWLGTQNGLNRYDGYRFKVFKHDSERKTSLSGVYIYSLCKDRSGKLWVGSDEFVDRFDPETERFSRYRLDPDEANGTIGVNVSEISQDTKGDIWLPTRNGLYRIDPRTSTTAHYRHDPSDAATLSGVDIITAGEDRSGQFWVGTSSGLDLFDRASGKVFYHLPLGYTGAGLQFHEDRAGLFWLIYGSEGRLAVFDRKANRLIQYTPQPVKPLAAGTSPFFSTMLEDRDGTMWFGTGGYGLISSIASAISFSAMCRGQVTRTASRTAASSLSFRIEKATYGPDYIRPRRTSFLPSRPSFTNLHSSRQIPRAWRLLWCQQFLRIQVVFSGLGPTNPSNVFIESQKTLPFFLP